MCFQFPVCVDNLKVNELWKLFGSLDSLRNTNSFKCQLSRKLLFNYSMNLRKNTHILYTFSTATHLENLKLKNLIKNPNYNENRKNQRQKKIIIKIERKITKSRYTRVCTGTGSQHGTQLVSVPSIDCFNSTESFDL